MKIIYSKICIIGSLIVCLHCGLPSESKAYELGPDGKCYAPVWFFGSISNYTDKAYSPEGVINADWLNLIYPSATILCKDQPEGSGRVLAGGGQYICNMSYVGIYRYVYDSYLGRWYQSSGLYPLKVFDTDAVETIVGLTQRFGPQLNYPPNLPRGTIPEGCEPPECNNECQAQQLGGPDQCEYN